jgi:hypothetical protein
MGILNMSSTVNFRTMKYFFLFIWLLPSAVFLRNARIREKKYKPSPRFYNTRDSTIIYPIVVTVNPAVNTLINDKIKGGVLEENDKMNVQEALRSMKRHGRNPLQPEVIV